MALGVNESFRLTDREPTVVHTLAKGSTSKEMSVMFRLPSARGCIMPVVDVKSVLDHNGALVMVLFYLRAARLT
jgi:hypothetical protein